MVSAVLIAATTVLAQGDPPTKPAAKPAEVMAVFHDGTTIRKAVLQDGVEITTKYGKLAVPVGDVRRIEFGPHVSDDTAKKIDDLIKQLGSDQFPQREAASKELIALGVPALRPLEAAAKSADKEVATRAKAALERIRETVPEERLKAKPDDVIHTRDGGVLVGRITNSSFRAQTENFGELTFKLANLRSIRSVAKSEAEVTVEAAQFHANSEKWLDTGFMLEGDLDLIVAASGQVDLNPQNAGQAVAGPEGYNNGNNNGRPYGILLGRIGETGEPFVIGKRYEGKPGQEGRLYVYIVPTNNGNLQAPTGSYKVNITAGYEILPEKKRAAPPQPVATGAATSLHLPPERVSGGVRP
jgi:hypothetical protein